ncbi:hypothetical protein EDB86DRAFT_3245320 [Lactarius hatsudake]|nr:hypothetical protein EDB86DRAFT_3245320 [Lactarius hatsudake]
MYTRHARWYTVLYAHRMTQLRGDVNKNEMCSCESLFPPSLTQLRTCCRYFSRSDVVSRDGCNADPPESLRRESLGCRRRRRRRRNKNAINRSSERRGRVHVNPHSSAHAATASAAAKLGRTGTTGKDVGTVAEVDAKAVAVVAGRPYRAVRTGGSNAAISLVAFFREARELRRIGLCDLHEALCPMCPVRRKGREKVGQMDARQMTDNSVPALADKFGIPTGEQDA